MPCNQIIRTVHETLACGGVHWYADGCASKSSEVCLTLIITICSGIRLLIARRNYDLHQGQNHQACAITPRPHAAVLVTSQVLSGLVHDRIICLLGACTAPPHLAIVEELAEKSLHAELHRNADGSERAAAAPMPYARVRCLHESCPSGLQSTRIQEVPWACDLQAESAR